MCNQFSCWNLRYVGDLCWFVLTTRNRNCSFEFNLPSHFWKIYFFAKKMSASYQVWFWFDISTHFQRLFPHHSIKSGCLKIMIWFSLENSFLEYLITHFGASPRWKFHQIYQHCLKLFRLKVIYLQYKSLDYIEIMI